MVTKDLKYAWEQSKLAAVTDRLIAVLELIQSYLGA